MPSSRIRGRKKQLSPPGAWARIKKASHIGADVNHLCPVTRYQSPTSGVAVVVLVRTSEPPCFSVMPMPMRAPSFFEAGSKRGS